MRVLMDICTIIAKNYLAAARVLATSFAEHHPGSRCHVLVVDHIEGYIDPAAEPFELVRPEEIGLPDFERMAGIYTVLELSTAVKPWFMRHLLEESADGGIVYLDPDIRIYAPLDEVFAAVREHGLVLNPHNTEPMPRDGRKPTEQDILIAGSYNLGFIGLGSDGFADELLEWWGERLEFDCIVDPSRGFFVDQRWIDLVPGMAPDFHLVRDPGFNVAYWNLPSRELAQDNGHVTVNGAPLRLFHFSGFKPDKPHVLSQHQDRIRLGDDPVLTALCDDYAAALLAAGHAEASQWPYTYARTASGITLDHTRRAAYRRAVGLGAVNGSPFTPEGEREFLSWCNGPATRGGEHGVTRYLEAVYDSRPDLKATYPDLTGPTVAAGFLGWVLAYGATELDIPRELLPPDHREARPPTAAELRPARRTLGVNLAGYLNAELGVGEVARQLTAALDAARVPVIPVGLHAPLSRQGHDFASAGAAVAPFDTNLICVNADGLPAFAEQAGDSFFAGRYSIGVWWWELADFPEQWMSSFELLDELWVGTRFIAEALQWVSPIPVMHVPLPLQPPRPARPDRAALGLPEGEFLFLFAFDYNSVFKRKNPLGLLEAFTRAFSPSDGVRLVLKSINHERDPDSHDRLRIAAREHPHVQLVDGYLSAELKDVLIQSCDAYASLHRSEGFGIGMAEALLRGKPVVATGYGGNTDYLDHLTGFPVRFSMTPVGAGAWPYPPEFSWAEPDLDDAARQLRAVVEHPGEAAERTERARRRLLEEHSPTAAGARIRRRLEGISAQPGRRTEESLVPFLADLDTARRRMLAGPVRGGGGTLGLAGRAFRKLALRAMRPYTAYADDVARKLGDSVQEVAETLEAQARERERRGALASAAALAEARRIRAEFAARTDELAGGVDELRAGLAAYDSRFGAVHLVTPAGPPPPDAYEPAPRGEPWSDAYNAHHRAFVARELDDPALVERFRAGAELPGGFGIGLDERVVEFPWIAAQRLGGRVLDAGSTLNHLHVLTRLRPRMDDLHIVTLAPEPEAFPQLGVSYVYADLRKLPFADGTYDRVLSISTLEHVGMDAEHFGAEQEQLDDPGPALLAAVRELRRVLRPGGDLYLTVPVGAGERYAWVRSLTLAEIDDLVEAFDPAESTLAWYRYGGAGWQRSERAAVADARYRDHLTSGPPGDDRLVAAEAVACLHLIAR